MPHQAGMRRFIIGRNVEAVHVVNDHILHPIHLLRQDHAPIIFDNLMRSRPEKPGKRPVFMAGNRILRLIAIALTGGCRQNRKLLQIFTAYPVQAITNPLRLQPGFLGIVHVVKIAATAKLCHGTFPIDSVG